MASSYSAFFSSGFHYNSNDSVPLPSDDPHYASIVPLLKAIDDASDVEFDHDRSAFTVPYDEQLFAQKTSSTDSIVSTGAPVPRPRKRRSSLTTSATVAIKSPSRSASTAAQVQKHLHGSPCRSRSGSLTSALQGVPETFGSNVASENTSLTGRMRSGSLGLALRPRRGPRRLQSTGPALPPPSIPLPPLPTLSTNGSVPPKLRGPPLDTSIAEAPALPLTSPVERIPLAQFSLGQNSDRPFAFQQQRLNLMEEC